ncbi:MAG TPA: zinc-ribbon domain-containing protein, partial [Candidatus Krumholzibacteria bacterium]|nr:zinc-ribbon domain-containing protein [Candidatus Krumholzibacteria bacterium]
MIIQCQSCAAKYFLSEEKVPANPLKVRCPKCRAVFMLAPRTERVPVGAGVGAPGPQVIAPASKHAAPMEIEPTAVARKSPAASVPLETSDNPAAPAKPAPKSSKASRGGKGEDRAKRLARVLVSDILYYNRERRDEALRDGTLMSALSEEIKKSWEL